MRIQPRKHSFGVGQAFASAPAQSPEEYLNAALRAEKFIAGFAHETEDGIYWKKVGTTWSGVGEEEIDQSFYSGTSGILYFYLKLYETTKEPRYLEIVQKGTRYLAKHWRDFFKQSSLFGLESSNYGIYMGVGGLGLVLGEVYRSTKDENARQGMTQVVNYYKETAQRDETGVYWTGATGLAMDGGILLLLLQQYKLLGDEQTKQLLLDGAYRLLKQGERKEDGGLEFNGCKTFNTVSWPNYEFGTAGSGYLLTLLYEFTGDETFLQAAKDCTIYLKQIQVRQSKGYLIPHDVYGPEGEEPVFFLSSCHGPGGNAKLYYKLYKLTGEQKWLDEINAMIDGIESVGAPERQSVGFWNTQCFCCGHAGLVQFFVGLYEGLGDERYLNLARRTAAVILGEKEDNEDGTSQWPMAFWRIKPEFLTVDLGYYDGQAGIASVLLQLYLCETGNFHWNRLIDDPFPES
jgi:lantibiotic modifying enzyme